MMIGKWWRALGNAGKCDGCPYNGARTMVGKASDRSSVHGLRTPQAKSLDNEEEIRESGRIKKGKEDKEVKRKYVENKVEHSQRGSKGGGDNG
ncbi:unnamed protein product [Cochlearia groenlandica]